jgi:hypothetical protein
VTFSAVSCHGVFYGSNAPPLRAAAKPQRANCSMADVAAVNSAAWLVAGNLLVPALLVCAICAIVRYQSRHAAPESILRAQRITKWSCILGAVVMSSIGTTARFADNGMSSAAGNLALGMIGPLVLFSIAYLFASAAFATILAGVLVRQAIEDQTLRDPTTRAGVAMTLRRSRWFYERVFRSKGYSVEMILEKLCGCDRPLETGGKPSRPDD